MIITAIVFILTLLSLVLIHEFGHFIVAKKFGVKVEEFGFGIPPKLFSKKVGETIVSLNLLPIGGFVRLFGEDETDSNILKDSRSFGSKPVLQRMMIVVAGVVMNFLLAVLLFWIVLAGKGFQEEIPLFFPFKFIGANQINETVVLVGDVSKKSPADMVGIKQGDRIIKLNDAPIDNAENFIGQVQKNSGEAITLTVVDTEDSARQIEVVPRTNPPKGEGPLGVSLGTVTIANLTYTTPLQKLASGLTHSYNFTLYSFQIFGNLIGSSINTKSITPISQTVSGPVGITQLAGSVLETKNPFLPYLNLIALLSLNLAVINILPWPALDGGRLFFLAIEFITRKKVNANFEKSVHTIGMIILLIFIVLVTFSDIRKLIP
ncbi:MAG: site-2 protease family protein [Candidatus Daviesbacteria bacterium]|nr:site-2 protease family protein [Candidatus Daviesbacteria bacterium]